MTNKTGVKPAVRVAAVPTERAPESAPRGEPSVEPLIAEPVIAEPVIAEPLTGERLERKFQAAWQLFQSVEGQVQMADRKVQAIFAANTLLVAAVSFQNQALVPSTHGLSLLATVGVAARLLLLACVCASYLSAIVALFPRLRHVRTRTHSLLFFGDIAALPGSEFAETFLAMPTADKVRQVLHQTHEVSRVVAEKYRWTRRSGTALVLSLLLWVAVQAITVLTGA